MHMRERLPKAPGKVDMMDEAPRHRTQRLGEKAAAKKTLMQNPTLLNLLTVLCTLFVGLDLAFAEEADARLNTVFGDYLDEYFRQQPLEATRLGEHRFDHLLEDVTPRARESWLAHARRTLHELPRKVDYAE